MFVLVMVIALAQLYVTYRTAEVSVQSERIAEETHNILEAVESQQDNNTVTLNNTEDIAQLIRDCTQPGGRCFAASQERTAAAVAGIGENEFDATVAGLVCYAEGKTGREAMTSCLAETLPAIKTLRERMVQKP